MFSGFQPSGYQHSGYQIVEVDLITLGGGYSYAPAYQRYREEEYQRKTLAEKRAALQQIEDEIAQAELAALEAAREMALIALQDEINRLRMERAWLMRQIDDEEAVIVLMLASPLH